MIFIGIHVHRYFYGHRLRMTTNQHHLVARNRPARNREQPSRQSLLCTRIIGIYLVMLFRLFGVDVFFSLKRILPFASHL